MILMFKTNPIAKPKRKILKNQTVTVAGIKVVSKNKTVMTIVDIGIGTPRNVFIILPGRSFERVLKYASLVAPHTTNMQYIIISNQPSKPNE